MFKALNELYDTEEVTTPLRYYDYTCSLESIAEQHIPVQGVQMESNDDSKSTDAVSSAASNLLSSSSKGNGSEPDHVPAFRYLQSVNGHALTR